VKLLFKPIPKEKSIDGWKSEKINSSDEKLVKINGKYENYFVIIPKYYQHKIKGAIEDMYMREGVLSLLMKASLMLPVGYKFVIWDIWRPVEVQESLFDFYKHKFKEKFPKFNDEELLDYTQKFVSLPSMDAKKPSPHLTGGSIDLTIQNDKGEILDMGTIFDEMDEKTKMRYYEVKIEKGEVLTRKETEILQNRRLLYHVMTSAGFSNYPEEWWHFDYGNQFWAKITGKTAIYSVIFP
jgi:D-alanyl-D-alanine dipeptidase